MSWHELFNACLMGNEADVKLLLSKGAPVNQRSPGGWTCLLTSANKGHLGICRLLLEHGAEVDATDYGRTALQYAQRAGHSDVAELLGGKLDYSDLNHSVAVLLRRRSSNSAAAALAATAAAAAAKGSPSKQSESSGSGSTTTTTATTGGGSAVSLPPQQALSASVDAIRDMEHQEWKAREVKRKSQLKHDLRRLLKKQILWDVKVVMGGKRYALHRPILKMRGNALLNTDRVSLLATASSRVCRAIREWIYAGEPDLTSFTPDQYVELMAVAEDVDMRDLVAYTVRTVCSSLRAFNVVDMIAATVDPKAKISSMVPVLQAHAIHYLCANEKIVSDKQRARIPSLPEPIRSKVTAQLEELTMTKPELPVAADAGLVEDMVDLWLSKRGTDCKVEVTSTYDSKTIEIQLHRCIIAARCPAFEREWNASTRSIREKSAERHVTSLPLSSFMAMIGYLYTGRVEDPTTLDVLYLQAEAKATYELDPDLMGVALDSSNCVDVFHGAAEQGLDSVRDAAARCIVTLFPTCAPALLSTQSSQIYQLRTTVIQQQRALQAVQTQCNDQGELLQKMVEQVIALHQELASIKYYSEMADQGK